ncbi:hypothetical protein Rsub_07721 [Raphidocelis subcapitata]|uniref:RAP domain-containing protein n=1 Tax=Raphidocelis subcapitata TaxID=307507 RepID=A0A2V0PD95_9CHLO|nr:hypothetical protein Rsub_07721 [Raphidocelis subcapitata]|eukprot:GBF95137.1 hypothetical protein Rsub_07721 [Raphidocelis subcapitata]
MLRATRGAGLLAAWARVLQRQRREAGPWALSDLAAAIYSPGDAGPAAGAAAGAALSTSAAAAAAALPRRPRGAARLDGGADDADGWDSAAHPPRKRRAEAVAVSGAVLRLERAGGLAAPRGGGDGGGPLAAARDVSESRLMALIKKAEALSQIERLLLDYGPHFRHMHVAAAVARLPEVRLPSANGEARRRTAVRILAPGIEATADQMDPHQAAACLGAFGSLRCAPPAALTRVAARLAADRGAALRALHPWELAGAARALAALRDQEEAGAAEAAAAAAAARAGTEFSPPPGPGGGQTSGSASQALLAPGAAGAATPDALSPVGAAADGGALARASPVEALWTLLPEVARTRLHDFPADDLAAIAWALARRGRASKRFMADACTAALPRPEKFGPGATAALTCALAEAGHADELLLGALARRAEGAKAEFTAAQLAGMLHAHADLGFYSAPFAEAAAKAATRAGALRGAPPAAAASLVSAFARLRHADGPLLSQFSGLLPGLAARLGARGVVDALWALLHLGHAGPRLEAALPSVLRELEAGAERLPPGAAARAVWCCAVLEEGGRGGGGGGEFETAAEAAGAGALVQRLYARVAAGAPEDFELSELALLHQAGRLLSDDWLRAAAGGEEDGAGGGAGGADADSASTAAAGPAAALPPRLARAAAAAARHRASQHAARGGRQQAHVADLLEELGLEPVRRLGLDGGCLVIDVAVIAGPVKVAVLCDGPARRTRSAPHARTGDWVAAAWLLERAGWRVLTLPWYEWEPLAGRGAGPLDALAHLANSFAQQGVKL